MALDLFRLVSIANDLARAGDMPNLGPWLLVPSRLGDILTRRGELRALSIALVTAWRSDLRDGVSGRGFTLPWWGSGTFRLAGIVWVFTTWAFSWLLELALFALV